MDPDTLKRMAIFSHVVDAGGYSSAARQIGLAKSAISKHITELEMQLGVKLINRTTRQISLTEAGNLYYQACSRLVNEAADATRQISGLSGQLSGILRVSCPTSLGNEYIVPLITAFAEEYPDLKIELMVDDQTVNLIEEAVDVAIRIGWPPDSSLIARKLTDSPRVICASPAYLHKHGTPTVTDDLVNHHWVIFTLLPTPYRQSLLKDGQTQTIGINGSFKTNNAGTLRSLILNGAGIGVLSEFMVADDIKNGRLIRLLSDYDAGAAGIYALYADRHFKLAKTRLFIEFLQNNLRLTHKSRS